jgi:hypothetical protein
MAIGLTITTPSTMHPLHPKPQPPTETHAPLPHKDPPKTFTNPPTHFHHSLISLKSGPPTSPTRAHSLNHHVKRHFKSLKARLRRQQKITATAIDPHPYISLRAYHTHLAPTRPPPSNCSIICPTHCPHCLP